VDQPVRTAATMQERPCLSQFMQERLCRTSPSGLVLWPMPKTKNPHAVALGRKGGKKGGKARWEGVSAEQRRAHAKKAAKARWSKKGRSV
jgi:hypothetical protein